MRARRPQRGYGEIAIAVRFRKEEKNEARVRSRRSSRIGSIVKTAHAEARAHKDRPRLAPIDGNPDLSPVAPRLHCWNRMAGSRAYLDTHTATVPAAFEHALPSR
jgi:hypothetical protein